MAAKSFLAYMTARTVLLLIMACVNSLENAAGKILKNPMEDGSFYNWPYSLRHTLKHLLNAHATLKEYIDAEERKVDKRWHTTSTPSSRAK